MPSLERHPLKPFLPSNAKVLMLGSFPPPQKRWSINFFYPNFQNDMWRIMGTIFFGDKNIFVDSKNKKFHKDAIIQFLEFTGIALYDTAEIVRRLNNNASDNFLEIVQHTNLQELLQHIPTCKAIVTTGEKATDAIILRHNAIKPKIGEYSTINIGAHTLRLYRMPSSSRAYPLALDKKAMYYHEMFKDLDLI